MNNPNFPPPYDQIEMQGSYQASYVSLHTPTGLRREETRTFLSRRHFLEALNKWNRAQLGIWCYCEA